MLRRKVKQARRTGKNIPGSGSVRQKGRSGTAEASGAGAEQVGRKRQEREVAREWGARSWGGLVIPRG